MPLRLVHLILIFLCLGSFVRADTVETRFTEGCALYEAGKFAEARDKFAEILSQNKSLSADLFYNLGCAEARLENSGPAALWLYRAVLLAPSHRESRQNLRFLQKKEGAMSFDETGFSAFVRYAKLSSWRTAFWASVWTAVASIVALLALRPRVLWPAIVLLCVSAVLGTFFLIGWQERRSQIHPSEIAVVTVPGLSALNAPGEGADAVISLNPGTQVHTLQTRGQWSYIELPGEKSTRGWVRSDNLEILWPWTREMID